jgi:osmotically inducible protein OsmC
MRKTSSEDAGSNSQNTRIAESALQLREKFSLTNAAGSVKSARTLRILAVTRPRCRCYSNARGLLACTALERARAVLVLTPRRERQPASKKGDYEIMVRKASAVWKGGLKDGKGVVSTDSGVLSNRQYSFSTRFEDGKGTNPEELIAAAHAGCFAMALSGQLGNAGMTAESLEVTAAVTLDKTDAGFTVTKSQLDLVARIPGADKAAFDKAAENAKAGCPISRLLKAEISLTSKLLNERATGA